MSHSDLVGDACISTSPVLSRVIPGTESSAAYLAAMIPTARLALLLLTALCLPLAAGDAAVALASPYTTGKRSPDGIGKFYLGREIAQVMGHLGAPWLDRPNREEEEKPSQLIELLDFKPGQVVADIGAGTGYYTFRIAPKVAKVLAVEIQQEMLTIIKDRAKERKVDNIDLVLGTVSDPKLPANSVDVVILVDVYHEFDFPLEMMTAIRASLKPDGRVVQVEFRAEDAKVPIKTLHKMSEAQARKEMESVGLVWQQTIATLPWQHVLIYGKGK